MRNADVIIVVIHPLQSLNIGLLSPADAEGCGKAKSLKTVIRSIKR